METDGLALLNTWLAGHRNMFTPPQTHTGVPPQAPSDLLSELPGHQMKPMAAVPTKEKTTEYMSLRSQVGLKPITTDPWDAVRGTGKHTSKPA